MAKADVLASVVTARTQEAFERDQQVLLDEAARLSVDDTRRMARWWQRLADQDGLEPSVPEASLRCTTASDGTVHLAGVLDAEGGAVVRSVLESIADQRWRANRADGAGERPPVGMGSRLRAEALVEMARLATTADPARSAARPLLSVLIDLPTLEGRANRPAQVEDGGILCAEAARRLACDADVARASPTPPGSSSTWAARPGRPHPGSGGRCVSATRAAPGRAVTGRPAGARPTTSSGGSTTVAVTWPTSHIVGTTPTGCSGRAPKNRPL